MKNILFIVFGLAATFSTIPSQAAQKKELDAKYSFNELEEVDSFRKWNVRSWKAVDSRSVIVDISPSQSYLIILDRNLRHLKHARNIHISSLNSRVYAGVDRVENHDSYFRPEVPVVIDKIYILPNRAARQDAREQILARAD